MVNLENIKDLNLQGDKDLVFKDGMPIDGIIWKLYPREWLAEE